MQRDDRSLAWPRLSVEGGAFVGREPRSLPQSRIAWPLLPVSGTGTQTVIPIVLAEVLARLKQHLAKMQRPHLGTLDGLQSCVMHVAQGFG